MKAQSGDSIAYADFLEKLYPVTKAFVSRKTKHNIEDLVQDVIISVHQARHTFDGDRPFLPWLYAIANFRISDQKRTYWRIQKKAALAADCLIEPEHENITRLQKEDLVSIVDQLPDKQKKIVKMLKFEGYSIKEIASSLDMTVAAVKISAHRAYDTIRILLTEES